MKVVITTMLDCYVYDLDTHSRMPIERPDLAGGASREAFGVTWGGRYAYIGWRHPCEVIEYDKAWKPTGRREHMVVGRELEGGAHPCTVHQLLYLEGELLIANTSKDEISVVTTEQLFQQDALKPHEMTGIPDLPGHLHYNTLFAQPGELYVVAHMHMAQESQVWKFTRYRGTYGLTFSEAFVGGHGAHNVFPWRGSLLVLDSNRARIIPIGHPEKVLYQGPSHTILRGVCWLGDALIVGCSSLQPDRHLRRWVHGDLLVWRDGDISKAPEVHKMGSGPISDLRGLDMDDYAHYPNRPFV